MQPIEHAVDTTVDLWEIYYKVRLPYLQSRTLDDIREKGTIVSGIPAYDNDVHNQLFTTYLTISQMADYFKEFVPIRVCDTTDTKLIYEAITRHILAWKAQLEKGLNVGDAPIEDLILLDRFANTVYEHAKYQFTSDGANSSFVQYITGKSGLNMQNLLKGPASAEGTMTFNKIEEQYESRDSLQDFFKSRSGRLRSF